MATTETVETSCNKLAEASDTPLLSMRNIHKSFGSLHALRGASIDVHAGEGHGGSASL